MKKLLIITTCINVILAVGCSKSGSSSNSTSSYSNFTLTTNNYDSGYYSHPNGHANWGGAGSLSQLLVSGYVDSLNNHIKNMTIAVTFNHKPSSSGTYRVATYWLNQTPLSDSTCDIILSNNTNQYVCNRVGDVVNVTLSNGTATINFSNVGMLGTSLNNNNITWSGSLSGTIIEGK